LLDVKGDRGGLIFAAGEIALRDDPFIEAFHDHEGFGGGDALDSGE
jgi:hypothetical protein